jgi:hypothetical protein
VSAGDEVCARIETQRSSKPSGNQTRMDHPGRDCLQAHLACHLAPELETPTMRMGDADGTGMGMGDGR